MSVPYQCYGTKTFAYEVVEQLRWQSPDTVVLPAGNGTLLLGAHLGFTELAFMGLIKKLPKLVAVQAAGCSPLFASFSQGKRSVSSVTTYPTLAEGIAIAQPKRGEQMLEVVRETDGEFLAVTEDEIFAAFKAMGRQGYCIGPTSAAVVAGATRYAKREERGEVIVTAFTGHGLKTGDKLDKLLNQ